MSESETFLFACAASALVILVLVAALTGAFLYYCGTIRRNPVALPKRDPKPEPEAAPSRAPIRSGM